MTLVGCDADGCLELCHVLDLDKLTLVVWWWISADHFEHILVELACLDDALAVLINLDGSLNHLIDALLGGGRCKDDREIDKWGEAVADGGLEAADRLLALVGHQIPLVDAHHETLAVLLDERENVHILCLDATSRIDHEDADIAVLDGAD